MSGHGYQDVQQLLYFSLISAKDGCWAADISCKCWFLLESPVVGLKGRVTH